MNRNTKPRPSAPECQLSTVGTKSSYETLLKAAENLTDDELSSLEDDLSYYAKTGLIGVYMSRLLAELKPSSRALAA